MCPGFGPRRLLHLYAVLYVKMDIGERLLLSFSEIDGARGVSGYGATKI